MVNTVNTALKSLEDRMDASEQKAQELEGKTIEIAQDLRGKTAEIATTLKSKTIELAQTVEQKRVQLAHDIEEKRNQSKTEIKKVRIDINRKESLSVYIVLLFALMVIVTGMMVVSTISINLGLMGLALLFSVLVILIFGV